MDTLLAFLRSLLSRGRQAPPAPLAPVIPLLPPAPQAQPAPLPIRPAPPAYTYKVSRTEVLMGRDQEYPLTTELEVNLADLLRRLNQFREAYGLPMVVSSGYRPGRYNTAAGGAPHSAHLTCQACDFSDPQGAIKHWVTTSPGILESCGLWMEDPGHTIGWIHLQSRPVSSGNHVFLP